MDRGMTVREIMVESTDTEPQFDACGGASNGITVTSTAKGVSGKDAVGVRIEEIEREDVEHALHRTKPQFDASGGASNGITVTSTAKGASGKDAVGVRIEEIEGEDVEHALHRSLEESGESEGGSQLVCSGSFNIKRKQSN